MNPFAGPAWKRLASTLAVALALAGCEFGGMSWLAPGGEEFPEPSVRATYASGQATVKITQAGTSETLTFDRVGPGSRLVTLSGATATWRTADGWILLVSAYDPAEHEPGGFEDAYAGDVTLQRVTGIEYWIGGSYSADGNRCIVDIDEVSESRISGSATCRGLRWTDGTTGIWPSANVLIDGQQPFDADLAFEATP